MKIMGCHKPVLNILTMADTWPTKSGKRTIKHSSPNPPDIFPLFPCTRPLSAVLDFRDAMIGQFK